MTAPPLRITAEIRVQNGQYRVVRRFSTLSQVRKPRNDLALHPDSIFAIRGEQRKLAEALAVLLSYHQGQPPSTWEFFLDEKGQFDLGMHLFEQLFLGLSEEEQTALQQARFVELLIVPADPFIRRLPWPLLVHNNSFLAAGRWSIALATAQSLAGKDHALPRSPKVLIVAPNPECAGYADTQADQHLEELETLLRSRDLQLALGKQLILARTWSEFKQGLEREPDVLYYYGHGIGDETAARLVFADDAGGVRQVPLAEFAHCIDAEEVRAKPLLCYINACYGDAGGALCVGAQLATKIPAVVANRTVAFVRQAQAQAKRFWEQTLLLGAAPDEAIRELYGLIDEEEFTLKNPRWMTPVFYRDYDRWKCQSVRNASAILDPEWDVKVDRESQFNMVFGLTMRMLKDEKPPGIAFVWFGAENDGMERFHHRLNVDLDDLLGDDVQVLERRPAWPSVMRAEDDRFNATRAFEEMYLHAFDVGDLSSIGNKILRHIGRDSRKTVVYIRHQVITDPTSFNGRLLRQYLLWWDQKLPVMFGRGQFALLGISYQSQNPLRFEETLDKLKLESAPQSAMCRKLDRLGEIKEHHLLDFVRIHKITILEENRSQILRGILQRTGGKYDLVIRELESLVERGYAEVVRRTDERADEDESCDFV